MADNKPTEIVFINSYQWSTHNFLIGETMVGLPGDTPNGSGTVVGKTMVACLIIIFY